MSDALKLADILEDQVSPGSAFFADVVAELRRLHAENEVLRVGDALHKVAVRQRDAAWAEVESLKEQKRGWLKENGPGGWIDNLRVENKSLLAALNGMLDQFNFNTITGIVHDESEAIITAREAVVKALERKR